MCSGQAGGTGILSGARSAVFLLLIVGFSGVAWSQTAPGNDTTPDDAAQAGELTVRGGAGVAEFRGEPLFMVRVQLGPLSPAERARAIEARVAAVASGPPAVLDKIRTEQRPRSTDVLAGEQFILSVTDADALPLGRTRQQLAADYAVKLRGALKREFEGRSLRGLVTGTGVALAATLVLALILMLLGRWFPRLYERLRALEGQMIRGLSFRGLEILSARDTTTGLVRAARLGHWLAGLVCLFIYVEVVLGAFPWTREFSAGLFAQFSTAVGATFSAIFGYLPNIFYIALILAVTHYLMRGIRVLFDAIANGSISLEGFYPEWAIPSFKILRVLVYALAAVVVFPYLPGSSSPAFQGVSLFLGLLLSLGSTSAIANLVAGVVLTYMRPFKEGDRVKIADTVGDVIGKDLLVVRVRTIKNVDITIPNAMVLNNHIINFSACADDTGLILHTTVTIGYDAPWRQVHELLIAAAGKTSGILAEPKPFVLQTSLDDFYVSYELNASTNEPNRMAGIYSELHTNIQDAFNEAGMEIMSPHYVAARDGNQVAIPEDYLPKSYVAPPFRILPVGPGSVPDRR